MSDHKHDIVLLPKTNETPMDYPNSDISSCPVTHDWLWPRIGKWLQDGDTVLTETGTANYGFRDVMLPSRVSYVSQVKWSSIGYALAACQGVSLARRDQGGHGRVILFTGEGSFQVSCQELSKGPLPLLPCGDC